MIVWLLTNIGLYTEGSTLNPELSYAEEDPRPGMVYNA